MLSHTKVTIQYLTSNYCQNVFFSIKIFLQLSCCFIWKILWMHLFCNTIILCMSDELPQNITPYVNVIIGVYYALVYSHLKYIILFWGNATEVDRIFILQKRILRKIFSLCPIDSVRPFFKPTISLLYHVFCLWRLQFLLKNT